MKNHNKEDEECEEYEDEESEIDDRLDEITKRLNEIESHFFYWNLTSIVVWVVVGGLIYSMIKSYFN